MTMHATRRLYLLHEEGGAKDWLAAHARPADQLGAMVGEPDDGRFICLVDGETDHACAAVLYDRMEAWRFIQLKRVKSKAWFFAPTDAINAACPELADFPWSDEHP